MTDLAKAHALVVRLRSGDPRANFWKICADTIEAQASEIERLRAALAWIAEDDGGGRAGAEARAALGDKP